MEESPDENSEGWMPLEMKKVPKSSDVLKTKTKKLSKKKVGNYYAIVFRILFNHAEIFGNLSSVSKSSKQTLDISKGLMITEILQRIRDFCGLSYRPDEQPVYEVLNRMKYQKNPYVNEYAVSKGKSKDKPRYFLTVKGFKVYEMYRKLESAGEASEFIKGIEDF